MGWDVIAGLIVSIGVPATKAILAKIEEGGNATLAEFNTLLELESRSARDRMLATLKANNIDPASPQGIALLAAV